MFHSRVFAPLAVIIMLLALPVARASGGIGIEPIPDQTIPSGKTLVVPIPSTDGTDPNAPPRTYTVTVGAATTGTAAATAAGINAVVRTGDPHLLIAVNYAVSGSGTTAVYTSGTMEFQLLREYAPITSQIIGGLASGGYYNPSTSGTNPTRYLEFGRVLPEQFIQLGFPSGDGRGGPGFTFDNEYSPAVIFSGTFGQVAMANTGAPDSQNSQFFITLDQERQYDYGYTCFAQLIRGADTLTGVNSTPLNFSTTNQGDTDFTIPANPPNITSIAVKSNNADAVLMLSATGVCDAPVTVVATSGTVSTTGTFMAHAVADSFTDPPYLAPLPDITAPNGSVNVALQATDLQRDFLRYGYQRLAPGQDTSLTTGTSPLISIPLISNTDNEVGVVVDLWNSSSRGYQVRDLRVGAGDKPIRGSLTQIPAGHMGAETLTAPFTVATFTAGNPRDTAKSFTTSVNWGDGSPLLSGSEVSIIKDSSAATVNRYKLMVTGTNAHKYTTAGEFPLTVKIADPGGARLTLSGTVNIGASTIGITPADFYNTGGVVKNQTLGSFTDIGNSVGTGGYATTINWGDGAVSAGELKAVNADTYKILGSHTYTNPGAFTVSTTVARTGTNYTGTAWSTAHIAGVTAKPFLPPFSQANLSQVWSALSSDSNTIITTGSDAGGNPVAPLVQGTNGFLYGVTRNGGAHGYGTVFKTDTEGDLSILHTFTSGTDGGNPVAAVVQAPDGSLIGTTGTGGANGYGTVYRIDTSGSFTTLHSFNNSDGATPLAPLVAGTDGFFYGTTAAGGDNGRGTLYKISTSGTFSKRFSFTQNGTDGGSPTAPLVLGTNGLFYGTTETSGSNTGTIYSLVGGTDSTVTTVNTLITTDTANMIGIHPTAGLTVGSDGNLYGVASAGGANGHGTIFEAVITGTTGTVAVNTVYNFTGGNDGGNPTSGLASGTDGNLYGTSAISGSNGVGVLYSYTPGSPGSINILYTFTRNGDGRQPEAPPVMASDGDLYGTAYQGGANGFGSVYQYDFGSSALSAIYSFGTGTSFQLYVDGAVDIINSGNVTSQPATFTAFLNHGTASAPDDVALASGGKTVLQVNNGNPLKPGQYYRIPFTQEGTVSDTRPVLPIGYDLTGNAVIGVLTYHDPVGDFNGTPKTVSPASF